MRISSHFEGKQWIANEGLISLVVHPRVTDLREGVLQRPPNRIHGIFEIMPSTNTSGMAAGWVVKWTLSKLFTSESIQTYRQFLLVNLETYTSSVKITSISLLLVVSDFNH